MLQGRRILCTKIRDSGKNDGKSLEILALLAGGSDGDREIAAAGRGGVRFETFAP